MARSSSKRPPAKNDRRDSAPPEGERDDASDEPKPSSFQLWFEDAWEGWIRPVGMIVLLAAAVMLYKFDLVSEHLSGVVAVVAILAGTLATALPPAWPLIKKPVAKAMLYTMLAAWTVGVGYPSLRAALPGRVVGEARLKADQLTTTLHADAAGPYDVTVLGQFKSTTAEAEATYSIVISDGKSKGEVDGALKRSIARLRTSRRGGSSTSVAERNEEVHRLAGVTGPDLTLTCEGIDEQLDGVLLVQLRVGSLPVEWFWGLGALAFLLGLVLDTILTDGKTRARAYLAAAMGISVVFAVRFPQEATPHLLVRAAVSELLLSLAVGGLGGWLLSAFTRLLFGPKLPKKVRKRSFNKEES